MPPRVKARAAVANDDSEDDDLNNMNASTGPENKRTMPAATRAKTTRRASAGKVAPKRKAAPKAQPRQALKDRTNEQHASDTEEVDEFDNDNMEASKPKAKRAKTAATSKTTKKAAAPKAAPAKKGKVAKRAASPEPVIPETQQDPDQMDDVEQSIEISLDPSNMDIEQEPTPKPVQKYYQRAPSVPIQPLHPRPSARPASVQPAYAPVRERSGSAGGGERRVGDPELRRALNDMTKKYENLQLKYESLEDVSKEDAETNFQQLKRASDQKAKGANELIAALKKDLADVRKSAGSSEKKQISTLTATNEKIAAERDDLKEKLKVSQNEVKSMEAKLIAARQQLSSSVLEAKAQATAATKLSHNSTAGLGDAQKEAKMKENLYADLTGLIVCGVKRLDGEDVYDCIQTGRNGSKCSHSLTAQNDIY